jgi:hypothetical protein
VLRVVSQSGRLVNVVKNGSASSITNASVLTIMHAALSSVKRRSKSKPSVRKNSIALGRSRTARFTNILRACASIGRLLESGFVGIDGGAAEKSSAP